MDDASPANRLGDGIRSAPITISATGMLKGVGGGGATVTIQRLSPDQERHVRAIVREEVRLALAARQRRRVG